MLGPRRAVSGSASGRFEAQQHPDWDRFQAGTEREIPVVVLEHRRAAAPDTRFAEAHG